MKILKIKSIITEMKDLPDGFKRNWILQKKKKRLSELTNKWIQLSKLKTRDKKKNKDPVNVGHN